VFCGKGFRRFQVDILSTCLPLAAVALLRPVVPPPPQLLADIVVTSVMVARARLRRCCLHNTFFSVV